MPYRFSRLHKTPGSSSTDAARERRAYIIENLSLPAYPGRAFTAYLDAAGYLLAASSRRADNGCGSRDVHSGRNFAQWVALETRCHEIFRFEQFNADRDGDKRQPVPEGWQLPAPVAA